MKLGLYALTTHELGDPMTMQAVMYDLFRRIAMGFSEDKCADIHLVTTTDTKVCLH